MTTLFSNSEFTKACNQIDMIATDSVAIYFISGNGFHISGVFKTKKEAKLALKSNLDTSFLDINIFPTIK